MKTQFDAVSTPLLNGINLLEASAGTGKTYTIAMLVLRFIVERDSTINKLLVVTFTKAATEELKHRIRTKLVEAKRAIHQQPQSDDATVANWLRHLALTRPELTTELIKQRLELALLDIDQAGIFTIHSFCQRVLREHALESGQLFDAELTDDLSSIKQSCVDDFWRKQIYTRSLWDIAVLSADYATPDELLASIAAVPSNVLTADTTSQLLPDYQPLDAVLTQLKQIADNAAIHLKTTADTVQSRFNEGKFKDSYCHCFTEYYTVLKAWLNNESNLLPSKEALNLLTHTGLIEGLHGGKFRAAKGQRSAERKADYLASFAINTTVFDQLAQAAKNSSLLFRRALLESLRLELNAQLQKLNVMSFDNLITRLAAVLQSEQGALLTAELQQRFTAALIDEFQDTDEHQWQIFSTVFATKTHALYLIGDPKQAIYKFRGADIYSYLDAQRKAEHQFTLSKNWRSQPYLISAVNVLFKRDQAFLLADLSFTPVAAAKSIQDGVLTYKNVTIAPMMLWQLPDNDASYWTAAKAATIIRTAVVNEILQLLNDDYRLQPQNRLLQAQDIAILVRSNGQARDYQQALRHAQVPSVINSTESVFSSIEARELYTLLQAVANPSDTNLLKQALSLPWFALNGQALYQFIHDETRLQQQMDYFLYYHTLWQQQGLMAMMHDLLNREHIKLHLATSPLAERQLTNLYHLIELLQQTALDEHLAIHKTIDWLAHAITKNSHSEHQQLRLESDDNAVKIITLHRAKGLEYAVVFCPALWQRHHSLTQEKLVISCHRSLSEHGTNQLIVDLGSDQFEAHRQLALQEELAEDLRLFYVAVTRAKYRCYLTWANVRFKETPNNSAMAWLLGDFAQADFLTQQKVLRGFSEDYPEAFAYHILTLSHDITGQYSAQRVHSHFSAKKRHRLLYSIWQMSSYTALSALSIADAPELPKDKVNEPLLITAPLIPDELPRGAHTGNVVHDLLEHNAFNELAQGKDISEQRDKACFRYGLSLTRPEQLNELLTAVVSTPLSSDDRGFCLRYLADTQCLKEMPFYLAMNAMDVQQINNILGDEPSYQSLSSKQMCGYLTGFIDLICQYRGRYYVMDYKTNSLADYTEDSLVDAMREHNYGLQYWLYTVVLHRYLQQRLTHYDYERDFGGVRYLFVRGMRPEIAMSAVYSSRPELIKVQALAALFLSN